MISMRVFFSTVVGAIVASAVAASAATTYQRMTTDTGENFLIVSGEFDPSDSVAVFVREANEHHATAVVFNSPGGNVVFGMKLGRAIRSLGLSTVQLRASLCTSACALAFLGGVNRYAEPGSIGVHQNSFSDDATISRDDAVDTTQRLTADLLDYLAEMGVSTDLLKIALRYDRRDIRYLSGSEMADLNVTTSEPNASSPSSPTQLPPQVAEPGPAAIPNPGGPSEPYANRVAQRPSNADVVRFIRQIVEAHTKAPELATHDVIASYADNVDYFGRVRELGEVVADKQAYFKRWPERTYRIRPSTVDTVCGSSTCTVTGIMDWKVRSLPRNRQASGIATFRYEVDFSVGLRVISESSRIIKE